MTTQLLPTQPHPADCQNANDHRLVWQWRGHDICYQVYGDRPTRSPQINPQINPQSDPQINPQSDPPRHRPPLVLIHGFGASIGHWRKNSPVFANAGYQVFVLDLLGFGASAKPPLDYSLELWEELLADFWHTHIHRPAVFVGNSIGGLLALMMMAHHPHMTAGGTLLNCAGGLNHRPEELNPILGAVMGTFSKVVSAPVIGPVLFNEIRRKFRIRGTLKQVYGDNSAITDELVEILHQPSCDPGAQKVFASILTAPAGPKPSDLLSHITQPLLVLWGDADPWTPISGSTIYQELATTDAHRVTFHPIPGAGHCPHDESPARVNPLILEWLEKKI